LLFFSGRRPRWGEPWFLRGQTLAFQDGLNDAVVHDGGYNSHLSTATIALEDVDSKRLPQKLGPIFLPRIWLLCWLSLFSRNDLGPNI